MNIVRRSAIKTFFQNHLSTNCMLEQEIIQYIFHMLLRKGKIFNNDETYYSWGEFYAYVSSFHFDKDTCTQSVITHAAAIELLVLATDIFDDISDHDQSDEIISHFIYRRNGHHCQYAYDGSISTHSS
ncbi:hypothetical protein N1I86_14260 [Bacillus sp. FSL W8-0116]|uniref:hypothetical protein n=1 Tax=Bacillus TaxID=1386 RepID=UPI0030F675DC